MCGAPGRPIVPSRGLRVLLCRMLIPIAATASAAALGAWAYGTYEPNGSLFGRAVGRGATRERVGVVEGAGGPSLAGGPPAHCAPAWGAVGLGGTGRPGAERGRAAAGSG